MLELLMVCLVVLVAVALIVLIDVAKSLRSLGDGARQLANLMEMNQQEARFGIPAPYLATPAYLFRNAYLTEEHHLLTSAYRAATGARTVAVDAGYGIWAYRGRAWELVENRCQPGFNPGTPPQAAGLYDGDSVKQECTISRS